MWWILIPAGVLALAVVVILTLVAINVWGEFIDTYAANHQDHP